MLIPHARIADCFSKVNEVTEYYRLWAPVGGGHTLKSISGLITAVGPIIPGPLTILELEELVSVSSARAFFLAHKDGGYQIVHLAGQNLCWQRLVLCKELFHVLLDSEETRNIGIAQHLDEFMTSFPDTDLVPGPAVISEWIAEFGAMEFLFPYADRKLILERGNYDSLDIAQRYRVPRVMIERYLSGEYMRNMAPFFK